MAIRGMSTRTLGPLRRFRYTLVVTLAALIALANLTGTWPSTEAVYGPMALALAVGLLLTVLMISTYVPVMTLWLPNLVFGG